MEFRVLGPFELRDGDRVIELPRQKHRALLAALLLHGGEDMPIDRLIEDLWGEDAPSSAKASLHNFVSQLRRTIGSDVLRTRPSGYVLDVGPGDTDLARFEQLIEEAGEVGGAERVAALRGALALWRGPPLADLAFEPFAPLEIARLEELRTAAEEELVDAELATGKGPELVARLEQLIAAYPLRERLRGQLMLALYRSGRQAEALDVYQQARRMLMDELGLAPGHALRSLEQAILSQDPALVSQGEPASDGIAGTHEQRQERRATVTVLFSDVVGWSSVVERLDPEVVREVMRRYLGRMVAVVEHHGGTVEKFAGDEVMAVFGVPAAREDDALRAVRAAVAMREQLADLDETLEREHGLRFEVRIGINTGEVMTGPGRSVEPLVTGYAVNVGKRLEQAAAPGEILLGPATLRLVRDVVTADPVGAIDLRGGARPLPAFRFAGLRPGTSPAERHLEAPLVGREGELRQLRNAFDEAVRDQGCRMLTVLGEAGIGKSRLAVELGRSLEARATVLVGRCVAYGEGATYLPLRDVVAAAVRRPSVAELERVVARDEHAEVVAARVAELVGLVDGPSSSGEAFWATRRFLTALARSSPVVLILEDLHWGEPTFLDLVEYLGGGSWDVPICIVCVTRPELLDERPDWPGATIPLAPLGERESRILIENAADPSLPRAVRARIVGACEGNPLFAEQLLAHAAEGGSVEAMPPSIQALLASRLDRLPAEERAVIDRAAVAGREFTSGVVAQLLPADAVDALDALLATLAGKGLIRPTTEVEGGSCFSFQHVLIRDVCYEAIPKARRVDLHEAVADWLEDRPASSDEVVGYHLEQAARCRADVGPADGRARRLADSAGEKLGAAGLRAWKRIDTPATVNLLERATSLLLDRSQLCRELLCELAIAQRLGGDPVGAEAALERCIAASVEGSDRRAEARARIELAYSHLLGVGDGSADELLELADGAIPLFDALGDERSLGRALLLVGFVQGGLRCLEAERQAAAEDALLHYRRAGWPTSTCIGELSASLYFGPSPVPAALARCEELLAGEVDDRSAEANVLVFAGGLTAMRGQFAEARALVERARATYEDLGQVQLAATYGGAVAAGVELLAGDAVSWTRHLEELYRVFEQIGDQAHLTTCAAELAEAMYRAEDYKEARRLAQLAERTARADDIGAQVAWRSVRSKLLARTGSLPEAIDVRDTAIRLSNQTDALNQRAKVHLDAAEVARLGGSDPEVVVFTERAQTLYELKGNLVGARETRARLSEVVAL